MKKLILAIAALALIASPALAVDWNFYGSARMSTFYESRDYNNGTPADLSGGTGNLTDGFDEDDQIQWEMQGNSRLGATVKAENVRGRFEWGVDDDGNNVTARRLFGTWNFGAATLKVGKDYTPVKQFISGQAGDLDAGLIGYGAAYGSRNGQIGLNFGGFEFALIDNDGDIIRGMATGDVDLYLPKVEAAYGMSFDTWNFKVLGGFQMYTIEDGGAAEEDVDVTAYIVGADAGVNFGPVYVKAAANMGTNWADGGWAGAPAGATYDGDDDTDDVDTYSFVGVVGFKFTDQLTFEAGGAYINSDSDAPGEDESDTTSYYLQAVISLAPGVWLIPEVGGFNYGDDFGGTGRDAGDAIYLGAKWQIDF